MISAGKFNQNLQEILDITKNEDCKDCKHYKRGYTVCDGFQCGLATTGSLELLGYVDPMAWKGAVCVYDERLKDLKKVK